MKLYAHALVFLLVAPSITFAAAPNINPGEWEFEMKMKGMPKNVPAKKFRTCMDRSNPVPEDGASYDNKACKTNYQFMSSESATWTATCKIGNGTMTTQGKGTYQGDKMEVAQTTSMGGQTFTMAYSGRRVGVCPGKAR